jgi:hypothetical protein
VNCSGLVINHCLTCSIDIILQLYLALILTDFGSDELTETRVGPLQLIGVLADVHSVVFETNQRNVCAWFQMALEGSEQAIVVVAGVLTIGRWKLRRK